MGIEVEKHLYIWPNMQLFANTNKIPLDEKKEQY